MALREKIVNREISIGDRMNVFFELDQTIHKFDFLFFGKEEISVSVAFQNLLHIKLISATWYKQNSCDEKDRKYLHLLILYLEECLDTIKLLDKDRFEKRTETTQKPIESLKPCKETQAQI